MSGTSLTWRRALARDHVARGHAIVERQRDLIRRIHSLQGDSLGAEDLLAIFERCQAVFEDDLKEIERQMAAQAG